VFFFFSFNGSRLSDKSLVEFPSYPKARVLRPITSQVWLSSTECQCRFPSSLFSFGPVFFFFPFFPGAAADFFVFFLTFDMLPSIPIVQFLLFLFF